MVTTKYPRTQAMGRGCFALAPITLSAVAVALPTFISLFGADRAGIVGPGVVLIAGLVAMLFVRTTAVKVSQPV